MNRHKLSIAIAWTLYDQFQHLPYGSELHFQTHYVFQ